jgi:hypothetical protein
MAIQLGQHADYRGNDLWQWSVWLEAPDAILDQVEYVIYTLHSSFPNPVRTIRDRASKFRVMDEGWSTFTIYAQVVTKGGDQILTQAEVYLLSQVELSRIPPLSTGTSRAIAQKLSPTPSKKLLALDGGGVRSIITVEVLSRIETILRQTTSEPTLVLSDYFDYIGGTSTGAIIAACLAVGKSVSEVLSFYLETIPEMFDKASLFERFRHKFRGDKLSQRLRELFGQNTTLGSEKLRTLLMIVLRNATTDGAWFVTNNPRAKYNERTRADCNLNLPLWQIVRASTAAPTYFPPEVIPVGGREFVFVDGGLTVYNNPAFQLFLMASSRPYRLEWPNGAENILLVSVGAGMASAANPNLRAEEMNLLYSAASIPSAILYSANMEQDLLCRMLGNCRAGEPVDREVGDLVGGAGPNMPQLFTYLRYQAELDENGLQELGLPNVRPETVQLMDAMDAVAQLIEVGQAVAHRRVREEHFSGF